MKTSPILVCVCITLIFTIAEAQRYSKINKPVIDLNTRPQVTTRKLPEERRKLSVFPKNMVKYVVTSKPYSKVRSYSPWEVSTKRPLMQKLVPKDVKTLKLTTETSRPPLRTFTIKPPIATKRVEVIKAVSLDNEENYRRDAKTNFLVFPNNNEHNVRNSGSNNFAAKDYEPEGDSTDEILSFSPTVHSERPNEVSSTEESTERQTMTYPTTSKIETLELDNSRSKRLSVRGFSEYNNIDTPSKKDSFSSEERNDKDEFIFINNLRPVYIPITTTNPVIEDDAEIATETAWLDESDKARPESLTKLSVN